MRDETDPAVDQTVGRSGRYRQETSVCTDTSTCAASIGCTFAAA
jgi:hypothetical protein